MRRYATVLSAAALLCLAILAPAARAEFGFKEFDVAFTGAPPAGSPVDTLGPTVTQAGAHPFQMVTSLTFAHHLNGSGGVTLEEAVKDILLDQVEGFVGAPTAVPKCATAQFLTEVRMAGGAVPACPPASALGVASVQLASKIGVASPAYGAVYNLQSPPGVASRLGFWILGVPVTVELGVASTFPYKITGGPTNITQALEVVSTKFILWGNPADPVHDPFRGRCLSPVDGTSLGKCEAGTAPTPFLTVPRACKGPLATNYALDSWPHPGIRLPNGSPDLSDPAWVTGSVLTHNEIGNPVGFSGCGKLAFEPEISAVPTSKAATSPSGLDFSLDTKNEGLANPNGVSNADVEKAVVTLPEGFSTNPSLAEGLSTCSEAQLGAETPFSAPGQGPTFTPPGTGCPDASKIGTVEVETPILEGKLLKGDLFIATPYENKVGSLLAIYMVIKDPELGILVKVPLKVESDPVTGQLTTVAEDLPPVPFSHFRLHFREGTRSPLATPPGCGSYDGHDASHEPVRATLYPSSGGAPVRTTSAFSIIVGPESGPCPSGGVPPFHPGLIAGSINNAAGRYSPFNVRLFRNDSEQEITHFSIKLPPGIVGKLAGIPFCSDQAIAAAKARTGPHGGAEELASPSCPAASEVGHTLVGAGVGPSPAYVPGKVYLAGPYNGSALSIAAITAAKAGPFDLGTVVVREALKINPETAEVFIDATGSDPLPHIIKGIPVHLKDIRAYVDKPNFVLNPTNCERTSTASTVLGSGANFGSEADDQPITVTSPFQAADCANLGFAPKLALSLKGGTKRGDTPKFKAVLTYPKGSYANIKAAQVTLPHSEFLEQSHIKTICTRVQFAAGNGNGEKCPAASIYGFAKAITPLLDDPIQGPVYLRSSSHNLPDLVAALHNGQINIDLVGRIDSVKNGRIRNTFESVPDAPVTSFTLEMQGGKKGLLVNSTNLCKRTNKAIAHFTGQNGKVHDFNPPLQAQCPKGRKGKKHKAKPNGKSKAKRLAAIVSW
jgi:hypothetical protein